MSLVREESRDGVVILTLDRPRANALSPELVEDLSRALEQRRRADAVVLTSSLPTIFSAGFDLPLLASSGRGDMQAFLDSFENLVREVFAFQRPVVAALPGHAVAGGLIVAMAADERIAAEGKAEFGLAEVALGVPVPACCLEVFRFALGARMTERLAASGENLPVDRALRAGLIDAVLPAEELLERSVERARLLARGAPAAYAEIKRRSRAEALARFDASRAGDPFLDYWFGEEARKRIGDLVARLTKKN